MPPPLPILCPPAVGLLVDSFPKSFIVTEFSKHSQMDVYLELGPLNCDFFAFCVAVLDYDYFGGFGFLLRRRSRVEYVEEYLVFTVFGTEGGRLFVFAGCWFLYSIFCFEVFYTTLEP